MAPSITVVIPAYNEGESLAELYRQIMSSVSGLQRESKISTYELLFVDDGSTDDTKRVLSELRERDENVHRITLRKNFGKSTALNTGFRHAKGDIIFTMDADLQDDPSEFESFLHKLDEGYDVVVGWKRDRQDPREKRIPSKVFNAVLNRLFGLRLHDHDCGFKAFRREVVESLDIYGELHRYIPILCSRHGFSVSEIPVKHHKREYGHSKYGKERYLRGLFDCLTAVFLIRYGDRPMYFFGKIGLLCFLPGFAICLYLTAIWFSGTRIGGRPLLVLGVLLIILGIQFISTGFIGNLIVDSTHRSQYREDHIREMDS